MRRGYTQADFRMYHPRNFAILAVSLALLAAGCSRSADAQPKLGKTVSACAALSQADAVSVLGGDVTVTTGPEATQPDGSLYVSNCAFSSDEARSANVLIRQAADAGSIKRQFADARAAVPGIYSVAPQDVPGLGDAAFWVGGSASQLNVLKGGRWVTIIVLALKSDDRLAIAKNTASAILKGF